MRKQSTRLAACPLCGNDASVTKLTHSNSATYNVSCGTRDGVDSDSCGLVLFGGRDTRKEMVEKWNRRIGVE